MEDKIPEIIERELKAKVIEIKRITEGFSHYMFDVKIDRAPFEVIVRFSNNKKETSNLAKEKWVIETMQDNNLPVPKIYAFNNKTETDYMILEKVKGTRLDTIWQGLSKGGKLQIAKEIGKLASRIHKIKLNKFGGLMPEGKIDGDEPFRFRDAGEKIEFSSSMRNLLRGNLKDVARLSSYSHVSNEFILKFLVLMIKNKELAHTKTAPTFIHGDYQIGHFFVERKTEGYGIVGLIDFEFAEANIPEYDFIKLHRQGFFEDLEIKKALEEGYGSKINRRVVEFCRIGRDLGFAWAVLEAGNKELSDKTMNELDARIDRFNSQKEL